MVEPLGVDYACSYASDVEKIKDTIKMKCDTADIEPVGWPEVSLSLFEGQVLETNLIENP